jgi:hexosaminidase
MKKTILFLLISWQSFAQNIIIPAPVSFQRTDDFFMLDSRTSIDAGDNEDAKRIAQTLVDFLSPSGIKLSFKQVPTPSQQDKVVIFEITKTPNSILGNEGYTLEINNTTLKIAANQAAGLFNGVQTLRQLLPKEMENKNFMMPLGMLQGCKITDYPRFGWRGLMLDVSRNFFTKEEVKKYIDVMARYKLNVLHWHLTDDNGWRIEIKSLPKLTSVGAWRVQRYGHFGEREDPKDGEPTTNGGFYTQDDIKEVVAYATTRNITIVPEVDIPGHSMAALAAYPELSTKKDPKTKVNPGTKFAEWFGNGKFKMLVENSLNPADEKVYEFVDKVFTEVAALFPNKYIHVGGDECYHGYWEADPACKALMKKENLKTGEELQSYFMKRVEKIVQSKGKKMIGWDEILEGGISPNAAVMSWRGVAGGIEAAKQGHEVVMSPTTYAYIDYMQGDPTIETPIYSSLSLKKAYDFEPIQEGMDAKLVLGAQANLWTEQIPTLRHAFYMTYPRALATAEIAWSPKEKKNWVDFIGRVENQFPRFDINEVKYSSAVYDAIVKTKMDSTKLICEMTCETPNTDIYYTIDETFPDKFSPKYTIAFEIPNAKNVKLRVITYRNGSPIGRLLSITREDLVKRAGKK